jgi:parvulin-like peptidyl-prolyl isomerase
LTTRTLLCVLALGAGVLVGCGDDDDSGGLPDDAVATVGDTVITKSDFERARKIASDPSSPQGDGAKARAMDSLIKAEWIRQEAEARHLTITDAELQQAVEQGKKSGFLSEKNLDRAGLTLQELMPTIRSGQLEIKVNRALTEASTNVSDQDVADYYERNRAELIVTERRDLRLVLATTRARAAAARAALDAGQSWEVVARRYSTHPSKDNGGKVENVRIRKGQGGLVAAVFRAKEGVLIGPVKRSRSWAVFLVEKVKPPFHASLEQARDEIRELLATRRRQRALAAFQNQYRARTTCAQGYTVPRCGNGPKQVASGA